MILTLKESAQSLVNTVVIHSWLQIRLLKFSRFLFWKLPIIWIKRGHSPVVADQVILLYRKVIEKYKQHNLTNRYCRQIKDHLFCQHTAYQSVLPFTGSSSPCIFQKSLSAIFNLLFWHTLRLQPHTLWGCRSSWNNNNNCIWKH